MPSSTATPEEIFSTYLDVRSRSGDELLAICPFHSDSSPSLSANKKKGLWTCYACGAGGGIRTLFRLLGLPASSTASTPAASTSTAHVREVLKRIEVKAGRSCRCSAVYSSATLSNSNYSLQSIDKNYKSLTLSLTEVVEAPSGKTALSLTPQDVSGKPHSSDIPISDKSHMASLIDISGKPQMSTGSSPGKCESCGKPLILSESFLKKFKTSSVSLEDYLVSRSITTGTAVDGKPSYNKGNDLEKAEVDKVDASSTFSSAPSTAALFELGWHSVSRSVVLPYRTETGLLLGVVYRRAGRSRPKYVYPVRFPRTETLYGSWLLPHVSSMAWLHRDILGPQTVVLCEGPFDVMKVWQAGLPAVGMWGSRLHDRQAQILSKLGIRSVVLFTDRDAAGRSAASSAAGKLLRNGKLVKTVRYPSRWSDEYSDPGSLPAPLIRHAVRRARWTLQSGRGIS